MNTNHAFTRPTQVWGRTSPSMHSDLQKAHELISAVPEDKMAEYPSNHYVRTRYSHRDLVFGDRTQVPHSQPTYLAATVVIVSNEEN